MKNLAPYERFQLSQDCTDGKQLEKLSHDELDIIRYNVLKNPYTPPNVKARLQQDKFLQL